MAEQRNPLREWRGLRSANIASRQLDFDVSYYIHLEMSPSRTPITTDVIFKIQSVTQIPLATLIDYFEQKEVV